MSYHPFFADPLRMDLVLYRGPCQATSMIRAGVLDTEKTVSGMWPSDHAGVVATLGVTKQSAASKSATIPASNGYFTQIATPALDQRLELRLSPCSIVQDFAVLASPVQLPERVVQTPALAPAVSNTGLRETAIDTLWAHDAFLPNRLDEASWLLTKANALSR